MGILTKLKNFLSPTKQPLETIHLNQLKNWIKNKEDKNRTETVEIMEFLEEKLITLTQDIKQNIEILKTITLEDKKAEQRAKFIVKQNLDHYIIHLEKLTKNLQELEIKQPNKLIKEIDDLVITFNEKSNMNFQKATFLIGKELGDVKDTIDNFYREIKNNLKNNKELIQTNQTINKIKERLVQINNHNTNTDNLNKEIETLIQKSTTLTTQTNNTKQSIEEIKYSEEYQEEIKQKQKIIKQKQTLTKEFQDLKQLINFKALTNIFHNNKKEMQQIKQYQTNFQETFEKNQEETTTTQTNLLIELLDSSKLNSQRILDKIKNIKQLNKQLKDSEQDFNQKGDANILVKENEIKKLKQETSDTDYNISRKQRKLEKINEEKTEIITEIKYDLRGVSVVLED